MIEKSFFPFPFVEFTDSGDCMFIQNVKKILQTDIQSPDKLGCKIYHCHSHAGSKIHFETFIEAELLFHNSYYNHGFAYLTAQKILDELKNSHEKNQIVLIGYESFSELYLQEVQTMLKENGLKCDYGIYEMISYNDNDDLCYLPQDSLMQAKNVTFYWNSIVTELLSDERLTGVRLRNLNTGSEHNIDCDGIFVSIGRIPATELVKDQLSVDSAGYIIADESTKTNIDGVFAVGDVRTKTVRQIVTAVGDGAVAVHFAEEFLAKK